MASAPVKAPEQPVVDITNGPYRVASALIKVQTEEREELHNLTKQVRNFVRSAGIRAGLVNIAWAIRKDLYYRHNDPAWSDCDRHNADSHLRSLMLGISLTLQIAAGNLVLGEWQSIIMAELDGPRERSVRLQAMGIASEQ